MLSWVQDVGRSRSSKSGENLNYVVDHLCVSTSYIEPRYIDKLRKLPKATTNVQKNKSYVGLFISYVGVFISYVGLYNSYVGDKIS